MYVLHIDPRKSSKWVAPPLEELVTTERIARGEVSGTGADLEASDNTVTGGKETAPRECFTHLLHLSADEDIVGTTDHTE